MEAMIERCAGLDVHQETVVACVLFETPMAALLAATIYYENPNSKIESNPLTP
ncbi:hypothetical protein AB1L12_15090 [Peribacillus frigoritolerans]|uniref:hypothetical protein n=1 Tax=Peribacillus frigoritolerans TaxID=450367 RepID=UPI0039A01D8A